MEEYIYYQNQNVSADFLTSPVLTVLVFLLVIIVLLIIGLFVYRYYVRKNYKKPSDEHDVVLMISVPKQSGGDKDGRGWQSMEQIKEQISWAENLWAQIGGLSPLKGFKAWLYGRHDQLSLEIVARAGLIYFYVVVPKKWQLYFEQQLQAHYPHAHIEEVEDYNLFAANAQVTAAALTFKSASMFPIKTYKTFESDPLNSITNVLSKLTVQDGAAVQLIIRPADKSWRTGGMRVASDMQQGKSLKDAMKNLSQSSPWAILMTVAGWFSTKAKKTDESQLTNYRLSPKEEEVIKNLQEKVSKAGLETNLRVVVSAAETKETADVYLKNILNSFAQYNIYEYGNNFKVVDSKKDKVIVDYIHRRFKTQNKFILNTEELASLYHFPLPGCETPNIHWLGARKAAAPVNMPEQGIILGKNVFRGRETLVRIKQEDRMRHAYVVGMTGTGKSKLMVNMAVQDIQDGRGVCYVDPHGEEVEDILASIPADRRQDVYYFDPADIELPIGLNMLEAKTQQEMDFATQEMITIFYKLLPDPSMAGPMFEHYMRNALLLLMADQEDPGTLVELARVFTDEEFREQKLKHTTDLMVRDFWQREYTASQRGSMAADMLSYVISKTGRFVENEMMRNIIGQSRSGFNFRKIMDEGKILLINLSKGKVGEVNSDLLGLIAVSKIQMAAMARADMPQAQRKDFMLYIDEFQNYITDSMAIILAEARKYRLSLNMAHQYIGQLIKNQDTKIRDAVFGNVGTLMVFRVGVEDAEFLAKQYAPVFNEFDLINIEKFNAYVRLLIDNQAARPFNMAALPPVKGDQQLAELIKQYSRQTYGRSKVEVEAEIKKRAKIGELGVKNNE